MTSLLVACCLGIVASTGRAASTAAGAKDGRLATCPDKPNCVSSQATEARHVIAPLRYEAAIAEPMVQLQQVVSAMRRTRVVGATDDYLHVEFTSAVVGFVDDVEFYLDRTAQLIHVRSASRVGHYDFGVNRKRVEAIRAAFNRGAPASTNPP